MSPDTLFSLPAAVLLGLAASGHCLGMCGGIACALGLQQHRHPLRALLLYHGGRVTAYCLLALLLGGALQQAVQHWPWLGPGLRSVAALLLLAMAMQVLRWWPGILALERAGARLWQPLQGIARKLLPATRAWQVFTLGLLWGWLPCGMVYSTLAWAASQADAAGAAALMAGFGLGTTPALLASGWLARQLQALLQRQAWRYVTAAALLLCAGWTLLSAWQHAGHRHSAAATQHQPHHHQQQQQHHH